MSDDLQDKTKEELAEIAASMDIEGRSSMNKDELIKAINKEGKKGQTSTKVTPVIPDPPDEPRAHERQGNPEALAETGAGGETADQSSLGGTVTGPDVSAPATRTPATPPPPPRP